MGGCAWAGWDSEVIRRTIILSLPLPRLQRRYRISESRNQAILPAEPEIADPPDKIIDVVSFLALVLQLDIHLFSASFHAQTQPARTGAGASFSIGQFKLHFKDLGFDNTDTYEDGKTMRGGDTSLGDVVVTKRIVPSRDPHSDSSSFNYANAIRPLVQELRVLAHSSLRDHENIVDLLGVAWEKKSDWTGNCWPIAVLEYAEHGNIYDYFASDKDLADEFEFCHDIVEGVFALHTAGVVHGDLKGENVLICKAASKTRDLVAKICDFGFAIMEIDYAESTEVVTLPGMTPRWAGPEVQHGFVTLTQANMADVYALGLLLAVVMQRGISPLALNGIDLTLREIEDLQRDDRLRGLVVKNLSVHLGSNLEMWEPVIDVISGMLASQPLERVTTVSVRDTFGEIYHLRSATKGATLEHEIMKDELSENETSDSEMKDAISEHETSDSEPDISSSESSESPSVQAMFNDGDDTFPDDPASLERLWDLPLTVQREVQENLERRASVGAKIPNEEGWIQNSPLSGLRAAKAGYLLFTLLMHNWQGVQHWKTGMEWLITAASGGYPQAVADLPRVASATKFELKDELRNSLLNWLNDQSPEFRDRFILDTIEDIDPASHREAEKNVQESWAIGPFPFQFFGSEWELALCSALDDFCSFAHISSQPHAGLSSYLKAVYDAIRRDVPRLLKYLSGSSPNSTESKLYQNYGGGLTWLHFSAVIGLTEIFQRPHVDPQAINIQDHEGRTPLFFAAACGNSCVAMHLLELRADGSLGHDSKGNTILHLIYRFPRQDIVKMTELLVRSGADVNALNHKQETPLHRVMQETASARSNHVAIRALLNQGADPAHCGEDGEVTHFWAVQYLQTESLELLLQEMKNRSSTAEFQQLQANLIDRFMFIPMSEKLALAGVAYPACVDKIVEMLVDDLGVFERYKEIEDNGGDSLFFAASLMSATDVMIALRRLWPSVDVDECDIEYGRPPLGYAIRHGKQSIFELLISLEADISYRDNTMENALHAAVEYAPAMLPKILDICASTNHLEEMVKAVSKHGHTPFDTAVIQNNLIAARLLFQFGVDLEETRCVGHGGIQTTLLGYLLEMTSSSIAEVSFLLNLGAKHVVSADGSTVFHALAMRGAGLQNEDATEFDGTYSTMPIFDLLLQQFPSAVHQSNISGVTVLHNACHSIKRDIVTRLLDLGVDRFATNSEGETALDIIAKQKQTGGSGFRYLLPRRRFLNEIHEIEKLLVA